MLRREHILALRLANQRIVGAHCRNPEDVVSWFGAVQAQDYLGALWALGLRTRAATEAGIEAAIARRTLIRTWPMRGTLHFVAAEDARWITRLLAPRILARHAARWRRDFGVTDKLLGRADEVVSAALEGGKRLSRERLYTALETRRIRTGDSRGLHLLLALALRGRLCLAGREGKQHTFALLDDWIPRSRELEGEAALTELALRYFTSHGPATQRDFMWWSGATARETQAALEGARGRLVSAEVDGQRYWWREARKPAARRPQVQLLPAFDEFAVAYHDRSLLLPDGARMAKMALLSPAVLIDGRVAGTWKRTLARDAVRVSAVPVRQLDRAESAALQAAVAAYGAFLGVEARLGVGLKRDSRGNNGR